MNTLRLDRRWVLVAVWFVSLLFWLKPGITLPDGAGYFVYLPSLRFDHDLVFFDEWQHFGMVQDEIVLHKEVTATKHLGNHWTVGSAAAWAPAYLAADVISASIDRTPFRRNGISLAYNLAAGCTSALAGLGVLLLTFGLARRYVSASEAMWGAIFVWFGSPLLFYSLSTPVSGHALASFAAAATVWAAMRLREERGWSELALFGTAAGFAMLVRPQLAVLAVAPLFLLDRDQIAHFLRRSWIAALAFLVAMLPELVVSEVLYGSPLGFLGIGSATAKPFAVMERIWWWEPLFSSYHGLLWWTPLLLIGVGGLLFLWRSDRGVVALALFVFASQWLINATMERSFWGAYSFGQRRFDCFVPFAMLGVTALLQARPKTGFVLSILASLWSGLLLMAVFAGRASLSRYLTPSETLTAILGAVSDVPKFLRPFVFVPPAYRLAVAVTVLALLSLVVIMAVLFVRLSARPRVVILLSYFALLSAITIACSTNDGDAIARDAALIEKNRLLQSQPGGRADLRIGLLSDELDYLQRSGRIKAAARTRAELDALMLEKSKSGVTP